MVEVFKTNVEDAEQADIILRKLNIHFPAYRINFDLADCDRILRVEGENIRQRQIVAILHQSECLCKILD